MDRFCYQVKTQNKHNIYYKLEMNETFLHKKIMQNNSTVLSLRYSIMAPQSMDFSIIKHNNE